ncbi:hypothetical protein B0H12DRAFT_1186624 [Mycena haematopus]|nr:hypothetical protein B0H12DRAFT_1186624 [Mycena haematopus]
MSAPRRIAVDDTDPSIQYGSTGWFVADSTKLDTLGNYGPVYNGTSHGTTTAATLSFPFNGTSITVLGTIAITTANNITDPTWACFVDQVQIANPAPTFQYPENWWTLCDTTQLGAGAHVLTIQVQSKGQPFYLDQILYTPLPTVQYAVAVLEYTNTDPAVSFGTDWQIWGAQNVTQMTGAQVALNFHGTQVSLFGYVPTELPHNSTSGSYTIDGGPPVAFTLAGLAAQSPTLYNNLFFTTNTLTPANHNLVVSYAGDSSKTPLAVGAFYVTNTSTLSTTSTTPNNPASSDTAKTTNTKSKPSPVGAIAGGAIGCVAVLAILVGLFFWCRRRRRRSLQAQADTSANPFDVSAADPVPGAQYAYASVPGAQQYAYASVPTLGSPTPTPSPPAQPTMTTATTAYPYRPPVSVPSSVSSSSQPRSDPSTSISHAHAHSPSGISHAHTPSGSSSANLTDSAVGLGAYPISAAGPGPGGYPTPAPSVRSKQQTELMRSAAFPTPAAAEMPLTPQRQPRPLVVQRHQDSGIRLRASVPVSVSEPEFVDLPPGYSRD